MRRWLLGRWQAAVLVILALLAWAGPASAHAIVISTDPADGAVLDAAPAQARIVFSEPIVLNFTTVQLTDSNGTTQTLMGQRLEAGATPTLVLELPAMTPGAYRLAWRALSADDLHNSSGSIVFGIGQAANLAPLPPAPPPAPLEVVLRWLNLWSMAVVTGAYVAALVLLPRTDPSLAAATRARLLAAGAGAAGLAAVAGIGILLAQSAQTGASDLTASTWQILTGTDYGWRWLRRELVLIGLALASLWLRDRGQRSSGLLELAGVSPLLLALVFLQALSSHAAGLETTSFTPILIDALHLLAVSVWVGCLGALALMAVPLLRRGGEGRALLGAMLRRFGLLAAASVAAITVTGLYNTGQQVASLDAFLFTLYGQTLIVKIVLVAAVGLIGLFNSAALNPRVAAIVGRILGRPAGWRPFEPEQLGRTILIEAIGGGLVILSAALLTAASPARGPEFEPPTPAELAVRPSFTANAADLLIDLSVKPNRPGQNFISLSVLNTRRPAPAPISEVRVSLTPPGGHTSQEIAAQDLGSGKYQVAGDAINADGEWQIGVRVIRPGLADTSTSVAWTVEPLARNVTRRPVEVSNQPIGPLLTRAAPWLAAAELLGLLALVWLGRRPAVDATEG